MLFIQDILFVNMGSWRINVSYGVKEKFKKQKIL